MLVLNLGCAQGHRFEGWFGSAQDFESQQTRGLVSCPVCASAEVQRLPSAPRLNVAHLRQEKSSGSAIKPPSGPTAEQGEPSSPEAATVSRLQQAALQALRQVMAKTEDVGERFAEEARRMHYGEAEERAIRGRASREDALALVDEGIELIALPEALKNPLQ